MTMDAGGNNLRLGNSGNSIKLTGFKGGIKREQLSNSKMQTIFDKVDKNGDGVLTDTEIAQFKKDFSEKEIYRILVKHGRILRRTTNYQTERLRTILKMVKNL